MPQPPPATDVELLIATMNRREPPDVLRELGEAERPSLLFINQQSSGTLPADVSAAWGRMLSFAELGLSRSRNRALDAARGELLLIGDDDLAYLPDVVGTLRRAFAAHPDATAITFQFLDHATRKPLKRYPTRGFKNYLRTIASVSSFEIALRRERLGALRFDTRFGVGGAHPSGEEGIFLADLLRAGHALYYWPEPLCTHPGMGSGHKLWSTESAQAKGAVFQRMYGAAWPLVGLWFAVAKYPQYRGSVGLGSWLWHTAKGARRAR
jgi:hypothetical protein